jgi:hypothetical protein
MFVRTLMVAALLSFGLRPVAARAAGTELGQCSLGAHYRVTSVTPYRTSDAGGGYYYVAKLRGAQVRIEAQPGLTSEWLQKTLQDELAAGACDFGARNVSVEVMSAGPGFLVMLAGPDERAAGEILHHAKQLSPGAAR